MSDGLRDFLGTRWLDRLAELVEPDTPRLAFVEAAVEAAFDGGAGDNVAVASWTAA